MVLTVPNMASSRVKFSVKPIGFPLKVVWVMGYEGVMGYGSLFPANQLGGSKILWVLRKYGLRGVWIKRGMG